MDESEEKLNSCKGEKLIHFLICAKRLECFFFFFFFDDVKHAIFKSNKKEKNMLAMAWLPAIALFSKL